MSEPVLPEGALGHHELQGFLFAVAAAPEVILPSEWLPLVQGGQEAAFEKRVLDGIMALHDEIQSGVFEGDARLPQDCAFREDLLSNLADDAPVSQWSRGFIRGHSWLEECWDEALPDELDEELGAITLALSFFASQELAVRFLTEYTNGQQSLTDMAETLRKAFPDALADYAAMGQAIQRARMEYRSQLADKIGRNDPCPCGSGRKFKRCCGASA